MLDELAVGDRIYFVSLMLLSTSGHYLGKCYGISMDIKETVSFLRW